MEIHGSFSISTPPVIQPQSAVGLVCGRFDLWYGRSAERPNHRLCEYITAYGGFLRVMMAVGCAGVTDLRRFCISEWSQWFVREEPPRAVSYSQSLWFRRRNGGYTIGHRDFRAECNRMAVEYPVCSRLHVPLRHYQWLWCLCCVRYSTAVRGWVCVWSLRPMVWSFCRTPKP